MLLQDQLLLILIPAHHLNVLHWEVPLVGFVGVPDSFQLDADTESYLRHHVRTRREFGLPGVGVGTPQERDAAQMC